jgi:hypothetical protein
LQQWETLVAHRIWTRLALVAIAGLVLGAGAPAARAVVFGPLALVAPSDVGGLPLTGTLTLDVASVPVVGPTGMRLTDVSATAGGFTITLDPTLLSPALGAVQADGSFTIPTLFLRVDEGFGPFDLAVPNVTGSLAFDPDGDVIGLASSFEIETSAGIQLVTVTAQIPEPGTALLVALGLSLVATRSRARQEIAR